VLGESPQPAHSAPTDLGKAEAALSKTGGTIFAPGKIDAEIAPGLMLPASQLNALRRGALEELAEIRARPRPISFCGQSAADLINKLPARELSGQPQLRIRLERAEQIGGAESCRADLISLPISELEKLSPRTFERYEGVLAAELPRFEFGGKNIESRLCALGEKGVKHALCGSLGSIRMAAAAKLCPHGDFSLNIANTLALEEHRKLGIKSAILSFEMTLAGAKKLGGTLPRGLLAYGYLPLMFLRNCPVRAAGDCQGAACNYPALQDRKGKRFFLSCTERISALHNCLPLWMADRREELARFDFLTLYFTKETPAQVAEALRLFEQGAPAPTEHTRGLYYRGVMGN